jgi:TRAP-type uncharacterized transport system fused permease subunit
LIKLGINPIAAHLFVLYFGLMSMITPPVALAAFAAASLAGSKPMETGLTAVRLGWIAYIIPFVFVLSPSLLMQGSATQVLSTLAMAIIGVWIASCGFIGYLFRPIGVVFRLLFVAAGLALLVPGEAFSQGFTINAIGGILAVLLIGREYMMRRSGAVTDPTRI